MAYTDETVLTFGKYKGEKLANIPAEYLLWLYDNKKVFKQPLKNYIERNMEVLKKETGGF